MDDAQLAINSSELTKFAKKSNLFFFQVTVSGNPHDLVIFRSPEISINKCFNICLALMNTPNTQQIFFITGMLMINHSRKQQLKCTLCSSLLAFQS
jgi:hypothetical protein